jgi:SAM-dependent methyltransferase
MNRNSLLHKAERAVRKPQLVVPYVRRRVRNWRISARTHDHVGFYRAVMADDVAAKSAQAAVGTPTHERWLAIGEMQFSYLTTHGLQRDHRLLEIGCGNLRAGWRFVDYLGPNAYVGVDISPDILVAAEQTIVEYDLQAKRPALYLVDGVDLRFLPADHFDVAHAHSVFSHSPLEIVEAYFRAVHRVLKPGGFFDFTYNRSDAGVWDFLREDFYFPTQTLLAAGTRAGFDARPLDDWHYRQDKIRLVKPQAV